MQFDHSALDLSAIPGEPVLVGVGGSHAYGMAHAESDIDYRGCFVVPTRDFWSLNKPPETYDSTGPDKPGPDISLHEVEKLLFLAEKGNPTVLEVFWYSEWAIRTAVGDLLIANRDLFISAKIRDTHFGYAKQQFERLKDRQRSFSADTAKRTEKHARHLLRLILQAKRALETCEFSITVEDRDALFAFGELPYDKMVYWAETMLDSLKTVPTALPLAPDRKKVNDLLAEIREVFLDG